MAPFPFPHLNEIREKYMFSITPFSPLGSLPEKSDGAAGGGGGIRRGSKKEGGKSDEEVDMDEDEIMVTCFTSLFPMPMSPSKGHLEGGESYNTFRVSESTENAVLYTCRCRTKLNQLFITWGKNFINL